MLGIKREDLKALIREVVQEELKGALVRTITVEKGPEKNGDPEKRIEQVEMNLLDFMATYLPRVEGRLLGMQADIDKTKNQLLHLTDASQMMGKIMLRLESPMLQVAAFGQAVQPSLELVKGQTKEISCGKTDPQ